MSDNNGAFALYYVVIIVAVASSLVTMRMPVGKMVKMVAAWVAIFGVSFVVFSFRSDFTSFGQRLKAEAVGSAITDGKAVRIPIADDGHFWVEAKVNGHALRFMVDSGASVTTVSTASAKAAGMPIGTETTVVSTANGPTRAIKGWADRLQVGPIERSDFPIDINAHDDTNLLGMNFLSSLSSWRVEGNYLVLQP
jgi:aspartyl protease family protein